MELSKGANAPLAGARATVELASTGATVDLSALLVGPDGKVRSDDDLVFYNQPTAEAGAVRFEAAGPQHPVRIVIDPGALPASVDRVVLVGSCDPDDASRHFGQVRDISARVVQAAGGEPVVFPVPPLTGGERAVLLVEVYRRGEGWKVRAVGQGYRDGLAGLARDFGVTVDETVAPAAPAAPAAPTGPTGPTPTAPAAPVGTAPAPGAPVRGALAAPVVPGAAAPTVPVAPGAFAPTAPAAPGVPAAPNASAPVAPGTTTTGAPVRSAPMAPAPGGSVPAAPVPGAPSAPVVPGAFAPTVPAAPAAPGVPAAPTAPAAYGAPVPAAPVPGAPGGFGPPASPGSGASAPTAPVAPGAFAPTAPAAYGAPVPGVPAASVGPGASAPTGPGVPMAPTASAPVVPGTTGPGAPVPGVPAAPVAPGAFGSTAPAPAAQAPYASGPTAPAPVGAGGPVPYGPGPSAPVAPTAPTAPTAPAGPLGAVSLAKGGQASISLDKGDRELVVTASLEWDGGSDQRRQRGADLDLYALFVPAGEAVRGQLIPGTVVKRGHKPQVKGKKGSKSDYTVYYKRLGSLTEPPFISLDGDARVPGRETIRITRPDQHGYVLLCAYSAVGNGLGSFRSFGAHAVVSDGRGSTVTVPLYENTKTRYWVALALIDFGDPAGLAIRHVEAYSGRMTERRPVLHHDGTVEMNAGPVEFKRPSR